MHGLKYWRLNAARGFVILIACIGLLLLFSSCVSAQVKVTATPSSVADAAHPGQVVLHVTKPDDTPIDGAAFNNQLGSVKVGGTPVQFQFDQAKGFISISPPAKLEGTQTVQLLDKNSQSIGQTELRYPGPTSSTSTEAPNRIEDRRDRLTSYNWYYLIVTLLFSALIIPFVYTIYRVVRFSRSSFRNPLGFPVGSFRAMLAYTLVAYLGFYILTSILSVSDFQPPDYLLGIVATVVGFYFGSRNTDEGAMDPGTAGIVRGIVRVGSNPARGATVKFKREDGTEPYSRITDIDGRFDLVGAKPGKYKVRAETSGSPPSDSIDITVTEGSDQEIVITIKGGTSTGTQTTGVIEGTVTKSDKTPADRADVVLTQGATKKEIKTDTKGKYKFENVAAGEYSIMASLAGKSSDPNRKVAVTAGSTQTVDLELN